MLRWSTCIAIISIVSKSQVSCLLNSLYFSFALLRLFYVLIKIVVLNKTLLRILWAREEVLHCLKLHLTKAIDPLNLVTCLAPSGVCLSYIHVAQLYVIFRTSVYLLHQRLQLSLLNSTLACYSRLKESWIGSCCAWGALTLINVNLWDILLVLPCLCLLLANWCGKLAIKSVSSLLLNLLSYYCLLVSLLKLLLLALYLLNELALVINLDRAINHCLRTCNVHSSTCNLIIRSVKHHYLTLSHQVLLRYVGRL